MIQDYFDCCDVDPRGMDVLWAIGFRHFGTTFFRYELQRHRGEIVHVLPLRIDLGRFRPSGSQKRVLRRNRDLHVVFREASVDEEKERLFSIHKERFKENVPESIYSFMSERPAQVPCPALECCLFRENTLMGTGYFDIGETAVSSIYTFFDPAKDLSRRSLGIYVLLQQIAYARDAGKAYLYHGYAFREASFYDYKKLFSGLEYFDWTGKWRPWEELTLTGTGR
jgi:leucyl-tRNA---protein transferase